MYKVLTFTEPDSVFYVSKLFDDKVECSPSITHPCQQVDTLGGHTS